MKMWNQTFRSDGRGVDKTDDMEQIIVYAQRGREAARIKAAIKRAAKSLSRVGAVMGCSQIEQSANRRGKKL